MAAQQLPELQIAAQTMRETIPKLRVGVGMRAAQPPRMATRNDPMTIPLLTILFTTLMVGFIMVIVVVMMN